MSILVNYKTKLSSITLSDDTLDLSQNSHSDNIDILTSYVTDRNLLTIIDFYNFNFFKTKYLPKIILFILNKIPDATITLRNISLQLTRFTANLKINKLYKIDNIAETLSKKMSTNNNYSLTITNRDKSFKILFISRVNTFDFIKINFISKLYHNENYVYYESSLLSRESEKFLKDVSFFYSKNASYNRPIKPLNIKPMNIFKSQPKPTIKSKYSTFLQRPLYPKSSLYKFNRPYTSPSLKPYLHTKTPQKKIITYSNKYTIQPYKKESEFTASKLTLLKKINLDHYKQIIKTEQDIEKYHDNELSLEDIKESLYTKIEDIEDYLADIKSIIKM
jgi:hypothetical protein